MTKSLQAFTRFISQMQIIFKWLPQTKPTNLGHKSTARLHIIYTHHCQLFEVRRSG